MKQFKDSINLNQGLRFVYDKLNISSAAGRKKLLAQKFITDSFELQMQLDFLQEALNFATNKQQTTSFLFIKRRLSQLNDIHQTIHNLFSGFTLDDVELFEIKNFSLISDDICRVLKEVDFDLLPFHNLAPIVQVLDPEKSGIPSFYIYSAYNSQLGDLRKQYDIAKNNNQNEKAERIRLQCIEIEDSVRISLSERLRQYREQLQANYQQLAFLDVLLAKAELARDYNLCKPQISETQTNVHQAVNLVVAETLRERNSSFQPVDIIFSEKPNLITGANMSGKTVILKTMSLVQMMFQYGFYVPARSAKIVIVEEVMQSIGDAQSEVSGLSSFAIEMLNIDAIIKAVKSGVKVLAVVDELARTTNPAEGRAIVNAFIKILATHKTACLITTHYNGIEAECNRLRVRGLILGVGQKVTPQNISSFMDYSLIPTSEEEVPTEGLTIAEIFGVDEEFIAEARKQLI